ncbi:MAG: beta-ketoacyl-[acyl-carrier-protein] synthase family protein [bacterium]
MKRAVITGIGAVTALGDDFAGLMDGLRAMRSGVRYMPAWEEYTGLRCHVGAPVELKNEKKIPRKTRRSMGRMSILTVQAAEQALSDAALDRRLLSSGRSGCVIGSTMGGAEALTDAFETMLPDHDLTQLTSMAFFQCLSHTAAMNVSQHLGVSGYVAATCAACASSLQAIGLGLDLIRTGRQDVVLCGGSEELHPTVVGSFDILYATSTGFNDAPQCIPKPFDARRDGLVCGEGAGVVLLEEYDHALSRGARPWAEVVGYSTCGSGAHITQSSRPAMEACLRGALSDARISAESVDLVNAHATGTPQGDAEEACAIRDVFGGNVPVNALKGHLGHTLGASGAIELAATLQMMRDGVILPTRNLTAIADDCTGIRHVMEPLEAKIDVVVKNCFAFGGINASLVCRSLNG